MPVILPPDAEAAWLSPDLTEAEALVGMLKPYPDDLLEAQAAEWCACLVGHRLNPELVHSLEPQRVQRTGRSGLGQ